MTTSWIKAWLRWMNLHPFWRRWRIPVWGHRLRAPTFDRWLALQLHRVGFMGVSDRQFLESHIKAGMTVVDIGANQGLYTLLFSHLASAEGRVLAFEPDDLLHAALQKNVTSNHAHNVQEYHLALGSEQSTMTLYRSLLNSGDNRLASKSVGSGPRDAVQVQIERLDEVLAGQRVHFVKMDVQGWEMEVFRGMQGLLDAPANAEMEIYFEYWPQGLRDAGSEPLEPLTFLKANGFTIHRLVGVEMSDPIANLNDLARSVPALAFINLHAVRPGRWIKADYFRS